MSHLRIRNWKKFQHYSDDRAVVWVKLYVKILDDRHFNSLRESDQAHLFKLFALAGRRANVLPSSAEALGALIDAQSPVNIEALSHWLEHSDGTPLANASKDSSTGAIKPSKYSNSSSGSSDLVLEDEDQSGKREKSKKRDASRNSSILTEAQKTAFDAFYAAYPKKRNRPDAWKAWGQVNPDPVELMASLEKWKRSNDWVEAGGTFVPYPASWLRARGWEDEAPAQGSRVTEQQARRGVVDYQATYDPVDKARIFDIPIIRGRDLEPKKEATQ